VKEQIPFFELFGFEIFPLVVAGTAWPVFGCMQRNHAHEQAEEPDDRISRRKDAGEDHRKTILGNKLILQGSGFPMLVLIVLLLSCLIFRAIGAAGVQALASWQNSALYALTVMFVFTATAHFNKMKHDLALRCYPVSTRINHVAMMMRNVLAPWSLS